MSKVTYTLLPIIGVYKEIYLYPSFTLPTSPCNHHSVICMHVYVAFIT